MENRWDDVKNYIKMCAMIGISWLGLSTAPASVIAVNASLFSSQEVRNMETEQKLLEETVSETNSLIETSEETEEGTTDPEALENPFMPLIQGLEEMKQLENYQITYSLTDLSSGEKVAEAELIGDQLKGDLAGKLDFYYPEAYPNHYQFDFISYRYFDLAYIQRFNYLNSMAFFQQPYFAPDMAGALDEYLDHYVALDNEELNRVDLREQQLASLLLLPDMRRLLEVNVKHFYEIDGLYLVSLERLEIPEYLFRRSENFSFSYELGLEINPLKSETSLNDPIDINSTQRFTLAEKANSLNFNVTTNSTISKDLMAPLEEGNDFPTPDFSRSMNLDSHVMLDKLTKVDLIYNANTDTYRIRLIGIVENIEFNFFTNDAAGLETKEYMLEYEIKPTDRIVPELLEIETLTGREADYIMEQVMQEINQ